MSAVDRARQALNAPVSHVTPDAARWGLALRDLLEEIDAGLWIRVDERVCPAPGGCEGCPDPNRCADLRVGFGITTRAQENAAVAARGGSRERNDI